MAKDYMAYYNISFLNSLKQKYSQNSNLDIKKTSQTLYDVVANEMSVKFKKEITKRSINHGLLKSIDRGGMDDYLTFTSSMLKKETNKRFYLFHLLSEKAFFKKHILEFINIFEVTTNDINELISSRNEFFKVRKYKYSEAETIPFINSIKKEFYIPIDNISTNEPLKGVLQLIKSKKIIPKDGYAFLKKRDWHQREFSEDLKLLYNNKCAVCGLEIPEILEGAHIVAYKNATDEEKFDYSNGILLCPNHHKMYDKKIITINDDYSITSKTVANTNINKKISLPNDSIYNPKIEYLRRH